MAPTHAPGGGMRAATGMRALWERQQRAAELAAVADRIPTLARSKPAFLAAQLRPVLAALQLVAAQRQEQQAGEEPAGPEAEQQMAAAAAHLRRLVGIDRQAGANASLLLWLLLESSVAGDESELQGTLLHELFAALGWQALALEALALALLQPQAGQQPRLAGLLAASAAAAAASTDAHEQRVMCQLVQSQASCVRLQLEQHSGGSSQGGCQEGLLAGMGVLQQLLLACPLVAAAPSSAADALQELRGAADACMAQLMQGMQQAQQLAEQQREQQQALFQQLCQLRARIMLAAAAAAASDANNSSGAAEAGSLHVVAEGAAGSVASAAQVWRTVLVMPPDVAAAAAAASSNASGDASKHPTRQQFLAACIAARSYTQAVGGGSSSGSSSGDEHTAQLGLLSEVSLLPGVRFEAPQLPGTQPAPAVTASSSGGPAAGVAAAGDAAAAEVERDPDCLGPVRLTLATLQLAQQLAAAGEAGASSEGTATWRLLLELATAAAGTSSDPREQRQLLLLLLHGQQAWLRDLRGALVADQHLQRSCRKELVAVANRLAADAGGGSGAPAVVHGEERRRRTAAAVAALLPHALLCPGAVLERVVAEGAVQAGEQVDLLLDVLQEMAPLAAYRQAAQSRPLLLALLARLLAPGEQPAALDTPGSRDAFLQLAAGLCGVRGAHGSAAAAAAAPPAVQAGRQEPQLSPAAVLQHVVAPALQQQQRQQTPELLLLPLQLAERLQGAVPGASPQPPAVLQPLLDGLLDLDSRRVDRSPAALEASLDAFELAASILQQQGGSAGASSAGAGAYFRQQLQPRGQLAPGLAQLRQRMVQLLAALLPCLTAAEAAEVLTEALPGTIQRLMAPPAAAQQPGQPGAGAILPGAHAAAVEAACRAARALALQPEQTQIAGEDAAAEGAPAPSLLRQVAVERTLQHLTQHCARLAPPAAGSAGAGGELRLAPAERQALGLRCFRELCQLAPVLQAAQYDCGTLQAGLLQLVRQLLAPVPVGGGPPQQQPAPLQQVHEQLAAAAGALPEGRLRTVVQLGIQQAAAAADL